MVFMTEEFTVIDCKNVRKHDKRWKRSIEAMMLQSGFSRYAFLRDLSDLEVDFFSLLLYVLVI